MANGKVKEKSYEKRTTTGSMSPELLHKVRVIGAHRGLGNSDVLDRYAGPSIDREYRKVMEEGHRELGEAGA